MKRFVVIATANRGAVEPHEPLDDAGQYLANCADEAEGQRVREVLRQRATAGYGFERDPLPTLQEVDRIRAAQRIRRAEMGSR